MTKHDQAIGVRGDDRIRELLYQAIESFPANSRKAAELWLFECEIARDFFRSIDVHGAPSPRPPRQRMN